MNIELAKKVLDYIEAHPKEHDQNSFIDHKPVCGTTKCIAGHAMLLSGEFEVKDITVSSSYSFLAIAKAGSNEEADYEAEGRRVLGISSEQANHLFFNLDNDEAIDYLNQLIAYYEQPAIERDEDAP